MTSVTFIIPTIGRNTLQRSIDCLLEQTIQTWKAIVIFDEIEPTIESSDERIKIMTCEKKGVGKNGAGNVRNYAIQYVDTEWIAFLDDDDTIANNYIEYFYKELEIAPELDTIIFRMCSNRRNNFQIIPNYDIKDIIKCCVGISFYMKKSLFEDGITFVPSNIEDFEILNNIKTKNYKIVISPCVKYFINNFSFNNNFPVDERIRTYINC